MSGQKPGSRFTDYFVVCGLDVEAGLEPDQLSGKEIYGISQGRRRRSGRTASAGPLLWPSMLSAVSFFLVSAHFTFYSDFIQSAKIY